MIGCGKLGLPCAEVMSEHYDVVGYDVVKVPETNIPIFDSIEETVVGRDIIFVAVPTPHDPMYGGNTPISDKEPKDFDYSIVKSVLTEIDKYTNKTQLVVLISTVLPGTTRKHFIPLVNNSRFIYNPYLIAMGTVKWDMVNPECLIIGTEKGSDNPDSDLLVEFYKPIMKNDPAINIGTWDEAESIKIFYNTFISAKIGLVNMIQDVAEANGNINVDVVTDALKNASQRITGPKYLTAGMGDGGACHPRDNIALRWLAKDLNLGYDLFHAIMESRELQAKNIAKFLYNLHEEHSLPVVMHGRAYKPQVSYTDGSYSELIVYYLNQMGVKCDYLDPLTGDNLEIKNSCIFFLAHNESITYEGTGVSHSSQSFYCDIPWGSIVVDPWRKTPDIDGVEVIYYGNKKKEKEEQERLKNKLEELRKQDPFIYD